MIWGLALARSIGLRYGARMNIRSLFATRFYEGSLGDAVLVAELEDSCRGLAAEDDDSFFNAVLRKRDEKKAANSPPMVRTRR